MASGFFASIFRFLIFFVNFAFLFLGGCMLTYGIQLHTSKSADVVLPHDYTALSVIILGGLVFIVAFFGCCGAFKEDSCMLRTYAILVLALLVLQIVIIVMVYKKPDTMIDEFKKLVKKSMEEYYTTDKAKEFMDQIQNSSNCCGFEGPTDYTNHNVTIPASCCQSDDLANNTCDISKAHKDGCYDSLVRSLKENLNILKWIVFSVLGFQAVSILIAFILANNIRRAYDVV